MKPEDRIECLNLIQEAQKNGARKSAACEVLEISVRTVERWFNKKHDERKGPKTKPCNSFSEEERAKVIETVNSKEYSHLCPGQIVPKLADAGIYIGSESSFYRIMKAQGLLEHRQRSAKPRQQKPDFLIAKKVNKIWSWDITYLKTSIRGEYFYLYLPMDIYSRKIVYWEVCENESAENAAKMIALACSKN